MADKLFHMNQAYDTEADRKAAEEADRQRRMLERQRDLDKIPLPTKDVNKAKELLKNRNTRLKQLEEENGI